VERFPDDPRALHLAGQLHYQLGETTCGDPILATVPAVRSGLCRRPDRHRDAAVRIGRVRGSRADADARVLQAPAHPQGGYLLASSLLNQGKLDQAEEVLRASLSIQSQSVATQVLLGQVLLQKKQPAEAKACFLAASRLAPDHANVWFGLASACAQLGEQEEAARHRATFQQLQRQQLREEIELTKDYDDRLALTQDLAAIYAAAGRLYHEQGDEARAERHWQSALKLDQGSFEARVELARLYQRQNRPKQALASWLPLEASRSEDVGFWLYLGQLYAQLDDFPQADEAFRRVIELAPDSAPGYAARAELRIKLQREADQAVRWARQAVERQASADHYFLLSVASRQHGDLAAAREAAERASPAATRPSPIPPVVFLAPSGKVTQQRWMQRAGGARLWWIFGVVAGRAWPCLPSGIGPRLPRRSGCGMSPIRSASRSGTPMVGTASVTSWRPSPPAWQLFDFDGDGWIDIYFLNGAPLGEDAQVPARNALYRNLGNWQFVEVTGQAGVGDAGYGLGVTVADFDNDGFPDLFLNNFGPNVLYRNNGDGTFTDVTAEAGVAGGDEVGAGAAFLDATQTATWNFTWPTIWSSLPDQHLSKTIRGVPAYVSPKVYPPAQDRLYRNQGDGTFADITDQSGIGGHVGWGMGMVAADYNNDGHTDVFIANDVAENFLFLNDGTGRFEEVGLVAGVAYDVYGSPQGSMGVDCGDVDNDGWLDFYQTSYQLQHAVLYRNLGDGHFEDVTLTTGAGAGTYAHVTWGIGIVDFDNSGHRDLFIACGHLQDRVDEYDLTTSYRANNVLLKNLGDGRFQDVSASAGDGLRVRESSRGAAFDDLDNNGRIDAVILNSRRHPTDPAERFAPRQPLGPGAAGGRARQPRRGRLASHRRGRRVGADRRSPQRTQLPEPLRIAIALRVGTQLDASTASRSAGTAATPRSWKICPV
jgi:tetratricopeptide (TPR) repeat protein